MALTSRTASDLGRHLLTATKAGGMRGIGDALVEVTADKYEFVVGRMRLAMTKEDVANYVLHHHKAYADIVPDHQLFPEDAIGEGDRLLLVLRHHCTVPNGEICDFRVVFVIRLDDNGRVKFLEEVFDSALAAPLVNAVGAELFKGLPDHLKPTG